MNSERIEEAAGIWLARRLRGSWTEAEQAEFAAWLGEDTAHRIAYLRLEAAWNHSARLQALGAGVPPGIIPPRRSWGDRLFFELKSASARHMNASGQWRFRAKFLTVAATVLLALSGIAYVYDTGLFAGDRYSTRVGAVDTVPLSDGSHVTLNTDSRIHVALAPTERRIDLDRGEAFFEVAKDPSRPFIVEIGNKRVIAVGTKFSVRRYGDDIRVVVTEGKVRVETKSPSSHDRDGAGTASPREDGSGEILVTAGSVAQTANSEVLVHQPAKPDVDGLLSWRSGYLMFHDTALADAVAEFNRYNTRKIVIEDPSIAGIRIGGNFRSTSMDAFLWLIQSGFPITVEQNDDQVILKAR